MKRWISYLLVLALLALFALPVSAADTREFVGIDVDGPNEEEMPFASGLYRTLYTGKPIYPELTVYTVHRTANGQNVKELTSPENYTIEWQSNCTDAGVHQVQVIYSDDEGNNEKWMSFFCIEPHAPTTIRCVFDWPNVILSWDASSGATGYMVKQFDEELQAYVELLRRENEPDSYEDPSTTQVIKGLEKGKTYWFAVQATPRGYFNDRMTEIKVEVPLDPPSLVTTTTTAAATTTTTMATATTTKKPTTTTTVPTTTTTPIATMDMPVSSNVNALETTAAGMVSGDAKPIDPPDFSGWIVAGIVIGALLIGGGITSWVLIRKKQ